MVKEECILDWPGSRFSGKARKQVLQSSESLVASISTKPFRNSRGGFSDQITSDRVQTGLS